jgi:excisionase family DNA binding protein
LDNYTLSIAEVAEYLGYKKWTVYKRIREGQLETIRLGPRRQRVTRDSLVRYLESMQKRDIAQKSCPADPGGNNHHSDCECGGTGYVPI